MSNPFPDDNWPFRPVRDEWMFESNFGTLRQFPSQRDSCYCKHCGCIIWREAWRVHLGACPALAKNRPV